ncbi:glutamate--tRNA ligase [Candidatus Giovannonibacteria bacterium]|nr:glutamate--tRNA ligase [Candidatus Giovannonibacteria bacterium]
MTGQIKTRFAPSPTGFLHVGGIRTALYNYLFAKQHGGKFILRIEDTDRARLVEGAEENIVGTLKDFGLDFDEGPNRQSENLEKYKKLAEELVSKGLAYADEGAIRFKMPNEGTIEFTDIIRGKIEIENKLQEDFVILKSDGYPTYNLAHLVDDHETGVTHVIRGEEFISSMPKYIALHRAFGWELPQYAHLPLLLNSKRAKLSKREGDVAVKDFLEQGYLKEAIINFVALLGWHPSQSDRELFSLEDLIKEFRLEDVQKAGAVFDLQKLDWMNGEYIRKTSPRKILELVRPNNKYIDDQLDDMIKNKPAFLSDEKIEQIIALEQPRLKKLSEIGDKIDFFFRTPEYDKELLRWKTMTDDEIKKSLNSAIQILQEVSEKNFTKEELEKLLLKKAEEIGDRGTLLWPLRTALSGKKASPGPFEIMDILGKEETLLRLNKALL